ncbi:Twinfilin-1 [Cyberlindnera fabianii]|uniref:Twinfilin-1 n=1 Tax=Cyberlindnera fabianii TaxID=36022 RepID=A0A1V2L771_CYBFA|nr:Twinfilin-1 [Cyberlindnera fabianii]
MSTQSGITPSEDLINSFKTFVSRNEPILIAEITQEVIELSEIINGGSSLQSDFSTLSSKLSDSEPKYIIIKHENNDDLYTFISYVPDYAAVKDKMLYASSKNTLIRQLGSELFANTLDFSFKFNDNTDFEFEENTLYSFNIDLETEEVFLSDTKAIKDPKEIVNDISPAYPQYNLIKINGKTVFIYSCPSGSKVKERMVYASNKLGVLNHFKKTTPIDKSLEVGDAVELELSEFEKEDETDKLASNIQSNLKFSRPTRPGRRK